LISISRIPEHYRRIRNHPGASTEPSSFIPVGLHVLMLGTSLDGISGCPLQSPQTHPSITGIRVDKSGRRKTPATTTRRPQHRLCLGSWGADAVRTHRTAMVKGFRDSRDTAANATSHSISVKNLYVPDYARNVIILSSHTRFGQRNSTHRPLMNPVRTTFCIPGAESAIQGSFAGL